MANHGDIHLVRTYHDLNTTICRCSVINRNVYGQVLHLADVVIGRSVKMCRKAIAIGCLVIDLVFEEKHLRAR